MCIYIGIYIINVSPMLFLLGLCNEFLEPKTQSKPEHYYIVRSRSLQHRLDRGLRRTLTLPKSSPTGPCHGPFFLMLAECVLWAPSWSMAYNNGYIAYSGYIRIPDQGSILRGHALNDGASPRRVLSYSWCFILLLMRHVAARTRDLRPSP